MGNVNKMGVMKWSFFEGRCLEHEKIEPAMSLDDFPDCKVGQEHHVVKDTSWKDMSEYRQPQYLMTVHHEDTCIKPKDSNRDGFSKANRSGCYNIVKGSLAGYSFLLSCVP